MSRSYDKEKLDRYYKSLYELLLSKEVQNSRKIKEIFKLLLESINFDSNITRISAFLKRLLQISLFAEPPFIACSLLITSQIIRNKNKLWKLFDKPESKNGQYDNLKREPKFSDGDSIPIYELIPFTEHYHPTIKAFANHILQFFNSKIIEYSSDPIIDLSLVNFLDKFILKNPDSKSKREMKKLKIKKIAKNNEDEDLINKKGIDIQVTSEFSNKNTEFIKKFNVINSKIPKKSSIKKEERY